MQARGEAAADGGVGCGGWWCVGVCVGRVCVCGANIGGSTDVGSLSGPSCTFVAELSFTTLLVVSLWRGPLEMDRGALSCVGGLAVRAVVLASSAVPSRDRDGLGWVPKSRSKPARLPHARLQVRTLPHEGSVGSTTL